MKEKSDRIDALFFVGSFKLGGTEKVAWQVQRYLVRNGLRVQFVAITSRNDYKIDENTMQVLLPDRGGWRVTRLVLAWARLFRILRTMRPRAIVGFSVGLNLFLFFQFYRSSIFLMDTNVFAMKRKWYYKYLMGNFSRFPHVRHVIIPSEGLLEACKAIFPKSKLVCIYNPMDAVAIDAHKNEPIAEKELIEGKFIISAGRLVKSKGFDGLIEAFSKSRASKDYYLVILGTGGQEPELRMKVKTLGLEGRVLLTGYRQNPYSYFSRAALFVLNTRFEGMPLVLLEALTCNTPVLCSDCDFGPREVIVPGKNGFLFPWNDIDDMRKKIERVLYEDGLRAHLAANARIGIDAFGVDCLGKDWMELLKLN